MRNKMLLTAVLGSLLNCTSAFALTSIYDAPDNQNEQHNVQLQISGIAAKELFQALPKASEEVIHPCLRSHVENRGSGGYAGPGVPLPVRICDEYSTTVSQKNRSFATYYNVSNHGGIICREEGLQTACLLEDIHTDQDAAASGSQGSFHFASDSARDGLIELIPSFQSSDSAFSFSCQKIHGYLVDCSGHYSSSAYGGQAPLVDQNDFEDGK